MIINLWGRNICVMLNALNFNFSPLFEHQNWKRYCAWYNQRRICSKYRANHTEMITKHILGGHKLWFKFNVTPAISSIKHQVSRVPAEQILCVWTFNKTYHNAFSKLFWFCYDGPLQHLVSVSVTPTTVSDEWSCRHEASLVRLVSAQALFILQDHHWAGARARALQGPPPATDTPSAVAMTTSARLGTPSAATLPAYQQHTLLGPMLHQPSFLG